MTINLPPLRERKSDLKLLADHFIRNFARQNDKAVPILTDEAKKLLERYNWPGNIRELENALKRAVVLADGIIEPEHFPPMIQESENSFFNSPEEPVPERKGSLEERLAQAEKAIITKELQAQNFNVSKTAKVLNVSRRTLQRKIKQLAINKG